MSQTCENVSYGPFVWDVLGFGVLPPKIWKNNNSEKDISEKWQIWNNSEQDKSETNESGKETSGTCQFWKGKSEKGQFWKGRILKRTIQDKHNSKKGQLGKGTLWKITNMKRWKLEKNNSDNKKF